MQYTRVGRLNVRYTRVVLSRLCMPIIEWDFLASIWGIEEMTVSRSLRDKRSVSIVPCNVCDLDVREPCSREKKGDRSDTSQIRTTESPRKVEEAAGNSDTVSRETRCNTSPERDDYNGVVRGDRSNFQRSDAHRRVVHAQRAGYDTLSLRRAYHTRSPRTLHAAIDS